MADVRALLALADGLATHLSRSYPAALRESAPATFEALASTTLFNPTGSGSPTGSRVTVWPYRVAIDAHARNRQSPLPPDLQRRVLPLEVQLLVAVWSGTVAEELTVFAWTLRELHLRPVFDAAMLSSVPAGLQPDERIEITPVSLSLEDHWRLWEGVKTGYRLSQPYVARIVQIDIDEPEAGLVVARRLQLSDAEGAR